MEPTKPIAGTGLLDNNFLEVVTANNGNISQIARQLGVSRTAVRKRLKRIQSSRAHDAGKVAIIMQQGFSGGLAESAAQLDIIQKYQQLLEPIEVNLKKVVEALDKPGRPNAVLIKTLTSLVKEARGIVGDSFKTRKNLLDAQGMELFMESVLQILGEYGVDARIEIYSRLSRLGGSELANALPATKLAVGGKP